MRLRTRPSARRSVRLTGGITLVVVVSAIALALGQQQPQPAFRSGVEVIAVDVQVVDKTGLPVTGLRADQFDVSVDGKPRKVVSVDLISATSSIATAAAAPVASAPAAVERRIQTNPRDEGRVFILAFDSMSFPPLSIAPAREAAHAFVDRLQPEDLVGLLAFPAGPIVEVTKDRAALFKALDGITGSASPAAMDPYGFTPSELIDLTKLYNDSPFGIRGTTPEYAKIAEVCDDNPDPDGCRASGAGVPNVLRRAEAQAQFEEMEIAQRMGDLEAVFKALSRSPRRKIVVLVSAGMVVTDKPGGRPDLESIGRQVGRAAAEANASVYALHLDRVRANSMSAAQKGSRQSEDLRDSAILGHSLDQIAGTSGGAFFRVIQGGGEFAFDQILKETSAYYLLGVAPAEKDRDGKAHELRVKVAQKDATVRGRSWVTLPKPDAVARAGAPSMSSATGGATTEIPKPEPKPLSRMAREVADAYGRRDYAAVDRLQLRTTDLASVVRDVQTADPPWPDVLRRGLVFSFELALAGLSSESGFAREEGQRLLTRAHLTVEQTGHGDAFACAWFHAEAAALETFWQPELGLAFVERARQQCPAEPRLSLARAVLLDQQWQELKDPKRALDVVAAYEDVVGSAVLEARVRASYLCYRIGDISRAAELMPGLIAPDTDPYVRYIYLMVQGHVLRARGRMDEASTAYQHALDMAPGAQSARVALMTLRLGQGQSADAIALADAIQMSKRDEIDPWWTYSRGDGREYSALLDRLREMGK